MQLNASQSSAIIIGATNDIKREIKAAEDFICRGSASDYAKYKEKTGVISGLKKAIELLNEHEKRLTNQHPDRDE